MASTDRRFAEFLGRACGSGACSRAQEADHDLGLGDQRAHRQGLLADRLPVDLGHLFGGGQHGQGGDSAGRQDRVHRAADYAFATAWPTILGPRARGRRAHRGTIFHPLNTADFSSFMLRAQSSGADVVALANGGTDTVNSIKQAVSSA